MKTTRKRFMSLIVLLLCCSIVMASSSVAFAAETEHNVLSTNVTSVRRVPSYPAFAGEAVDGAVESGIVRINIPAGDTARQIYFVGNKNGGGANTEITFFGTGISTSGKKAPLNGSYTKISGAGMSVAGPTTLIIHYEIKDTSTPYNLVFLVYD